VDRHAHGGHRPRSAREASLHQQAVLVGAGSTSPRAADRGARWFEVIIPTAKGEARPPDGAARLPVDAATYAHALRADTFPGAFWRLVQAREPSLFVWEGRGLLYFETVGRSDAQGDRRTGLTVIFDSVGQGHGSGDIASPTILPLRPSSTGLVEPLRFGIDDPFRCSTTKAFAACTPERSTTLSRFYRHLERFEVRFQR